MHGLRLNKISTIFYALLFLSFGAIAILQQNLAWMAIPFGLILFNLVVTFITNKTDQLFWLLLIFLPLSTELNVTTSLGIDFPDEVFLILLTAITIAKMIHQPALFLSVFLSPILVIISVQILWIIISSCFSTEPLLSLKYLLAKIWYIVPFVFLCPLLLKQQSDWKKLALCLCIPMLIVIVQTLIRFSFYGFEFASIKKTMAPFFRNHVNYSSMLVCLLPIGWALWKFTPNNSSIKKAILFFLLIAIAGLILSYSRGAWLALIVGLLSIYIFKKKKMAHAIAISIVSVIIFIGALINNNNYLKFAPDHDRTIFHSNFSDHLSATITMKDISNAERFHRWVAGIRMIAEKPIAGFGPNSFYNQYKPYTVSSFKTWVSNNPEHSTVHNYFLLVAIEQGIFGLMIFLVLLIWILLKVQQLYHQFQSKFYSTITMVTGIIIIMITIINCTSDMIETDKIGGIFWLCTGVLIALNNQLKIERESIA